MWLGEIINNGEAGEQQDYRMRENWLDSRFLLLYR